MKILLTHAYSKENKGDAVIVSVLVQQLLHVFPGAEITIALFDDATNSARFDGCQVLSNSMYHSLRRFHRLPGKLFSTLFVEGSLLLWAFCSRLSDVSFEVLLPEKLRALARAYLASDLFVPVGGGYLRAKKGLLECANILLLLNPMLIGVLLGKPVILHTQSIGPFETPFQGWIARLVLNKTQHIFAREDHTLKTLQKIGVRKDLITRTTDAAFLSGPARKYCLSDLVVSPALLSGQTLVGITVRRWLRPEGQANFEKAVADFIDRITVDKKKVVLFIPQVTSTVHNDDDRDVAARIVSQVTNTTQIINCTDNFDHHQLQGLYGSLDFLVGTRFHSVIFALTSYVPALAIEYEYKASGIMQDLGLEEWVIPIEQVTAENLYEKFQRLVSEKTVYKQQLQARLPASIARAQEVENQIKEVYQRFRGREMRR